MFRHFFGIQDPLTISPPRAECPNYKVNEFFNWLRYIWKHAWDLGPTVSADEQTCSMQGQSIYKTRCGKFKRIGDGIQTDAIADDGYTFDFYFRNEPVAKKWISAGLSPMHARLLHMFEIFLDLYHRVNMDNLFNSVKFSIAAANCKTKVLTQGVFRKNSRGAPPIVFQEEVTGKKAEAARGTVKAAVLKGDPRAQGLIVASCFDQKPFYMVSDVATKVGWNAVEKKVFSHSANKKIIYRFLRFNISDDYNFQMNDNDITDQLRLEYRMMSKSRNNKWWWALFLWGFEVSLANAFRMYSCCHDLFQITPEYSHYDFVEAVAQAWIDPVNYWPTRHWLRLALIDKNSNKLRLSEEKRCCMPFTDKSLCPDNGSLRKRLNNTLNHMPEPVDKSKKTQCQLHMWSAKKGAPTFDATREKPTGSRVHVMHCPSCHVHLCMDCFFSFHNVENLAAIPMQILGKSK